MKRFLFAVACMLAAALSVQAPAAPAKISAAPTAIAKRAQAADFADQRSVMDLKPMLAMSPAAPVQNDGSVWYVVTAVNNSAAPVTRVLQAGEPPDVALHFFPVSQRPSILNVASSDDQVQVTSAGDYARHAFRVTVPPSATVAIAMRVQSVERPPSILAWTAPALASQYRRLSIFIAAVCGLIGAAALITGGLAVMTGHAPPRWAAFALLAVFLARLSTSGMLDTSIATSVGGPYGLAALFAGLALAAGVKLVDTVLPIDELSPWARPWLRWGLYGLLALSLLSYLGVPGAMLLVEAAVLFGTSGLAAYLVHRGRLGSPSARTAAPTATVFALVALAAAAASVGVFGDNYAAPAVVGGFAAAGAVLLSLVMVAGEGVAHMPQWRAAALSLKQDAPLAEPIAEQQSPQVHRAEPPQTAAALAAIGASHQGVFDLDLARMIVRLSSEAGALVGKAEPMQFTHDEWLERVHPEDRPVYIQAIEDFRVHTGLAFRIEFRVRSEAGRYPWFELRATMLGEAPPASRCLGLLADVTTRKESEAASRPTRDALTALGNRVALMEELERLGTGLQYATFVLLDIDRFKSIHASLGDAGADAILIAVAERLQRKINGTAQLFRVGGDSYAALYAQGRGTPEQIGTELVEACAPAHLYQGRSVFAPGSAGVALGRDARDPIDLLKNAELALIQAKRHGGACVRVYRQEMEVLARGDSVVLEAELRRALDDDQLDVFYQPIVRLADRSVVGFEALLRWHHPTRGLVVPADFIAHSEETGLIVSLGRFALERAAKELATWQRFFPLEPPLFVSVNLSRRQLRDADFENLLRGVLARESIAESTLKLELTESAVALEAGSRATLERLKALGAGLAIDDFGTGVSNLSQLKDLPFDTLKIDRSFLARHSGQDDTSDATVVRSIVALARDLKRTVVVEGVETEHDAAWVKELGCEYAQGFCFSQALPASEALNFLAQHFDARTAARKSGATSLGG
jgi:diguanylate cyclase (GGDEF)-like protein